MILAVYELTHAWNDIKGCVSRWCDSAGLITNMEEKIITRNSQWASEKQAIPGFLFSGVVYEHLSVGISKQAVH